MSKSRLDIGLESPFGLDLDEEVTFSSSRRKSTNRRRSTKFSRDKNRRSSTLHDLSTADISIFESADTGADLSTFKTPQPRHDKKKLNRRAKTLPRKLPNGPTSKLPSIVGHHTSHDDSSHDNFHSLPSLTSDKHTHVSPLTTTNSEKLHDSTDLFIPSQDKEKTPLPSPEPIIVSSSGGFFDSFPSQDQNLETAQREEIPLSSPKPVASSSSGGFFDSFPSQEQNLETVQHEEIPLSSAEPVASSSIGFFNSFPSQEKSLETVQHEEIPVVSSEAVDSSSTGFFDSIPSQEQNIETAQYEEIPLSSAEPVASSSTGFFNSFPSQEKSLETTQREEILLSSPEPIDSSSTGFFDSFPSQEKSLETVQHEEAPVVSSEPVSSSSTGFFDSFPSQEKSLETIQHEEIPLSSPEPVDSSSIGFFYSFPSQEQNLETTQYEEIPLSSAEPVTTSSSGFFDSFPSQEKSLETVHHEETPMGSPEAVVSSSGFYDSFPSTAEQEKQEEFKPVQEEEMSSPAGFFDSFSSNADQQVPQDENSEDKEEKVKMDADLAFFSDLPSEARKWEQQQQQQQTLVTENITHAHLNHPEHQEKAFFNDISSVQQTENRQQVQQVSSLPVVATNAISNSSNMSFASSSLNPILLSPNGIQNTPSLQHLTTHNIQSHPAILAPATIERPLEITHHSPFTTATEDSVPCDSMTDISLSRPSVSPIQLSSIDQQSQQFHQHLRGVPCPLVTFGCNGRIVLIFPRKKAHTRSSLPPSLSALKDHSKERTCLEDGKKNETPSNFFSGQCFYFSLKLFLSNNPWISSMSRYPGPFVDRSSSLPRVKRFLSEKINSIGLEDMEKEIEKDGRTNTRLMWELLLEITKYDGKLHTSISEKEKIIHEQQKQKNGIDSNINIIENGTVENAISKLLQATTERQVQLNAWKQYASNGNNNNEIGSEKNQNRQSSSSSSPITIAPTKVITSLSSSSSSPPIDILLQLQKLLLIGQKKEASNLCVQHKLWPFALLIAPDPSTFQRITTQFVVETCGSATPLHTLLLLLAGNPMEIFRPFTSPNISLQQQQGGDHHHHHIQEEALSSLSTNWRQHIAIVVANSSNDFASPFCSSSHDTHKQVVLQLGDILGSHCNQTLSAHICYMIADDERPSFSCLWNDNRYLLLGANHRGKSNPFHFFTPEAFQRSEIWEFLRQSSNNNYSLPHLNFFRFFLCRFTS